MSERRFFAVEGNEDIFRFFVANELYKHIYKRVNGVCGRSVLCRERRGCVKSAVYKAVSVDENEIIHK